MCQMTDGAGCPSAREIQRSEVSRASGLQCRQVWWWDDSIWGTQPSWLDDVREQHSCRKRKGVEYAEIVVRTYLARKGGTRKSILFA